MATATTVRKMPAATREELDVHVTQINALVADMTTTQGLGENRLVTVSSWTKIVADVAELKAKLDGLVNAYNATLAKLDADATVTDTNYAATNPGTLSVAMTAAAPTSTSLLTQGGTAGRIKAANDIAFDIAGKWYSKPPADDLWDLHTLGTTDGTHYKAVALYLDSSGVASVAAGAQATSAAAAIAALEAIPSTKARVGVYVMGLSGNFANALNAQGTYHVGQPAAFAPTAGGITLIAP